MRVSEVADDDATASHIYAVALREREEGIRSHQTYGRK